MSLLKKLYQRAAKRIKPPPSRPIEIQIMGTNHIDILKAKDISTGGVGIEVPHRFEGCNLGAEVELIITLPGNQPFLARGIIKHGDSTANNFFGVQFTGIGSKNLERIHTYIDHFEDDED